MNDRAGEESQLSLKSRPVRWVLLCLWGFSAMVQAQENPLLFKVGKYLQESLSADLLNSSACKKFIQRIFDWIVHGFALLILVIFFGPF